MTDFNQSRHDEALALYYVSQSLDLVFEEYGLLYCITVAYALTGTVTAAAEACQMSPSGVVPYLNKAGMARRQGRPPVTHCKHGHDMDIYRRANKAGQFYCIECRRIRQRKAPSK